MDGRDYVSGLMQYLQGRQLGAAQFVDLDPFNVAINGAVQQKWICVCRLACVEGEFPREGYGVEPHQGPPMFSSKKTAKQYAAKQALDFFQQNPTAATRPVRKPQPAQQGLNIASGTQKATSTSSQGPAEMPSNGPAVYDGMRGPSVLEQISVISGRLGMGNISYEIKDDATRPNFFSGQLRFATPGKAPDDLGAVSGVYGKNETKLQVAEKGLCWLQEEDARRQGVLKGLLGKMGY